jgi:hypothetical protein
MEVLGRYNAGFAAVPCLRGTPVNNSRSFFQGTFLELFISGIVKTSMKVMKYKKLTSIIAPVTIWSRDV